MRRAQEKEAPVYVVIVRFTMSEADQPAFLDLVTENAARSLADEPGCRRFDVCVSPDRPGEVLLYEIYDDAAAFETHKSMSHYHGFSAAAEPLIASKSVQIWTLLPGGAA